MAASRHNKEVIEFELIEKLNVPVHWNDLQNNPALRDCEVFINNQGSLFKLTEEEYDIIRETLATWYDREKIHSANLYQLFSYLLNQQSSDCPDSFKTRGILIYPDTGKEIDLDYWYDQHLIQIKTLNLNVNWREIEGRLRGVV